MEQQRTYAAAVVEVMSGDDLIAMVDLGVDGLHKRVRLRLKGVDTPSGFTARSSTEAGRIRDMVRKHTANARCRVLLHEERRGSWLVTLYVEGTPTVNLNELLINAGYIYKAPT